MIFLLSHNRISGRDGCETIKLNDKQCSSLSAGESQSSFGFVLFLFFSFLCHMGNSSSKVFLWDVKLFYFSVVKVRSPQMNSVLV